MNPAAGATIDQYRVDAVLGSGSMGDVFRAIDKSLDRAVALKVLREKHRGNSEVRARFVREGRAVASINHSNVVQVFSTGTYQGRPYIAMELLHGVDLASVVEQAGPLSSMHAAQAIVDSAHGLQAAERAGLIHRDVKPANLVLIEEGIVKVTDFGLAKPLDPEQEPTLTAMGVVVGTPDYIAPEQARGDDIDSRVDIYALGGTLYYLLTGVPPFRTGRREEDAYLKVVARHLNHPVPDPRDRVSNLDDELVQIGMRMMEKSRFERPMYPELIKSLTQAIARMHHDLSRPTSLSITEGMRRMDEFQPHESSETGSISPSKTRIQDASEADRGMETNPADDLRLTSDARPKSASAVDAASKVAASDVAPASYAADDDSFLDLYSDDAKKRARRNWILVALALLGGFFLARNIFSTAGSEQPPAAKPSVETGDGAEKEQPSAAPSTRITEAPEGMISVQGAGSQSRFYASRQPVSLGDIGKIFPQLSKRSSATAKPSEQATQIRYSLAESYAKAKGMRLPTIAEWKAAIAQGASPAKRYEWISSNQTGNKKRVVNPKGRVSTRNAKGHKDVTFRLVQDIP